MSSRGNRYRRTAVLSALLLVATTMLGQVGIVVQSFSDVVPTPDGFEAYRIYAVLEEEEDFLTAVFGDTEHPLSIETTGTFYQTQFGSGASSGVLNIPSNIGDCRNQRRWKNIRAVQTASHSGFQHHDIHLLLHKPEQRQSKGPFKKGGLI